MQFIHRLCGFLAVMGLPGLLAISFLDSAAMPISGGPDAVVLLLAWQRPAMALVVAAVGAIGSTLGCLVIYGIAQKSGDKALGRFSAGKTEWVKRKMDRHGIWAIIAAVMAPPPFPTKLVVLAAGALRTGKARFAGAVLFGKFLRYAAVAFLGAQVGSRTSEVLLENVPLLTIVLIIGILLIYLARVHRNQHKTAGSELPSAAER